MSIWDVKLFCYSEKFSDICREKDDKCLLASKCIWNIIWFKVVEAFRTFIGKRMVNDYWIVCLFVIVSEFET